MAVLHRRLQEIKNRATPIAYSDVSVNEMGKLSERASLLDQRIVEGYGCIWGQKNSHDEIFHRGAFKESIANNGPGSNANYQIKFRDEHGKACALFDVLKEDDIGLYFRTKPLDAVEWADDLLTQLRSGTINNFSNGFRHIFEDDAIKYDDKNDSIDIFRARLFEISAVAIPSDMETFAVRSEELEYVNDDIEDFILSLPKSKHYEARKIITRCMTLAGDKHDSVKDQLQSRGQSTTGLDFKFLIDKLS